MYIYVYVYIYDIYIYVYQYIYTYIHTYMYIYGLRVRVTLIPTLLPTPASYPASPSLWFHTCSSQVCTPLPTEAHPPCIHKNNIPQSRTTRTPTYSMLDSRAGRGIPKMMMMICLPPQGTSPPHSSRYGTQHTQHTASTAATPHYPQGRRQTPADAPTPRCLSIDL